MHPLRILVADDDSINRRVLSRLLEKLGHRVDCVADGCAAVEAVRSFSYDAVIMDTHMPRMSGREATQAIRSLEGPAAGVFIIGLSGSNTADDSPCASREAQADLQLVKPIQPEALRAAIARAALHCRT